MTVGYVARDLRGAERMDRPEPKKPASDGWVPLPMPIPMLAHCMGYRRGDTVVLSEWHENGPHKGGPEFHVSLSRATSKPFTPEEVEAILADFGLDGAVEDNAGSRGIARHFWKGAGN